MIGIGDDVIISGKVVAKIESVIDDAEYLLVKFKNGQIIYFTESDIKSYHPYQPIPESDERRGQ